VSQKYIGQNVFIMNKMNDLMTENELVILRQNVETENKIMLKNAELKQKDSEIDIIKRDTTIELLKRDSTILLLKYENKDLKNEMNMMVMEQQLLEQKRINELLTNQI
jgi:hypothetical protein